MLPRDAGPLGRAYCRYRTAGSSTSHLGYARSYLIQILLCYFQRHSFNLSEQHLDLTLPFGAFDLVNMLLLHLLLLLSQFSLHQCCVVKCGPSD
jgi:hypothetical protein